jgi:hypothetical protein
VLRVCSIIFSTARIGDGTGAPWEQDDRFCLLEKQLTPQRGVACLQRQLLHGTNTRWSRSAVEQDERILFDGKTFKKQLDSASAQRQAKGSFLWWNVQKMQAYFSEKQQ